MGTWREQRRWGFDVPLEALGDHELHVEIEEGMNALDVEAEELDLSEFAEVAARDLLEWRHEARLVPTYRKAVEDWLATGAKPIHQSDPVR